jgi:hypothetical protein
MNLDYIEITKFLDKDKPNLEYLHREALYPNAERYSFQGCRKIEIWNFPERNQLSVKGSIPYFLNGHNFHSSLDDWKEGLDYLSSCLNLNLYSALIEAFEFGTIQEIPFPENAFLRNHVKIQGMEAKEYLLGHIITGKEFISPSLKVKLYDSSRNIRNKLDKPLQEEISRLWGWNREKHYIKLENHYRKPEAYFRGNLYVNEILSSEFQQTLQMELYKTYQKIMKTGNAIIPEKKADINAGTIPLIILKELESVYHFNSEEMLKAKLKEIPEEILSLSDRKARLKILRENLKKISISEKSEFDISELLEAKIQQEGKAEETDTPFLCIEKGEEILSNNEGKEA